MESHFPKLMTHKLDSKDYEILRELDVDFRQSFSKIAKKVKLSKNSICLRYEKLKDFTLHNIVGINYKGLGFTEVKIYYSFDFFNDETEKLIKREIKKFKNIIYAARFYGVYDLCICFLVNNLDDLIIQVDKFNQKFAGKINQKEMQIANKHFHFRYNFIHEKPIPTAYIVRSDQVSIKLTKTEKDILHLMRYNPRVSIVDIAIKTDLSPKTVATKIKELEGKKIIMGYFMTIDPVKFNFNTFKLLIQVKNLKVEDDFEKYLSELKNVKYIGKMSGMWDYEIDFIFPTITELQEMIEVIKEKFPNGLKKIAILSFGRRIATNYENFPV